jgi:predicted SAM-dependent methyltransferase
MREDVDYKIDITNIHQFPENSFDCIVCSHVLEHVKEDQKAVAELYRILKPGGWGILMVPIKLELEQTLEKPEIQSEADRWKYYGQNDHVRLYSKSGWLNRLKGAGFKVNQLGIEQFGKEAFTIHGIHPRSILYIVEK